MKVLKRAFQTFWTASYENSAFGLKRLFEFEIK
jgi:hypothetical protein